MTGIINFETFLAAGILLNLTPGNDTIFILSKSLAGGKKAGYMSALGIGTGSLLHTTFAAFGLSIIIARSILVFNIIKYAGAAYLLYLGYRMFTDRSAITNQVHSRIKVSYIKIYREAVLTNLLNPKVALFFIAFLPQFIDPSATDTILPFLLLGITFTFTGTAWCLVLAAFASAIFSRLKENKKLAAYINKACGLMLVALGIKVALTSRK